MNEVAFQRHSRGILLPVRAIPRARKAGLVGVHAGMLKVAVTVPAEKGRANEAIAALLAEAFGLAKSSVELLSGSTSPQKRFLLLGVSLETVENAIAQQTHMRNRRN